MTTHTNIQIIKQNGLPAFVVMDYKDYHQIRSISDEGKRTTFPHEVVGLNLVQGMNLLKAWRTYFGISQEELAKKTRTTQAQIANYECGKSVPRADTLMRLSNALGVSADLLWESEDDDVETEVIEE